MTAARPRLGALAAILIVVGAPAAAAQESGVVVDPNSPSGKEYALPLESARRQADPSADASRPAPRGEASTELFGAGIGASSGGGGSSSAGSAPSGSQRGSASEQSRRGPVAAPDDGAAREALRAADTRPGAPDGGTGAPLLVLASAAFVLALGTLTGVALRRRGRVTPL